MNLIDAIILDWEFALFGTLMLLYILLKRGKILNANMKRAAAFYMRFVRHFVQLFVIYLCLTVSAMFTLLLFVLVGLDDLAMQIALGVKFLPVFSLFLYYEIRDFERKEKVIKE